MIWKDYSNLKNTHAFCGASKNSWRNYTVDKLIEAKIASYATTIGTLLHEYASKNIKKHFKMAKTDKRDVLRYLIVENNIPPNAVDIDRLYPNLMNYVNDCIGYRMESEVTLRYSDDFYGTTDAISWENNELKIFDLKTGVNHVSFTQLENYAAFFCLDYNVKPSQIKHLEFRIYQNGDIILAEPDSSIIFPIISQIVNFDKELVAFKGDRR